MLILLQELAIGIIALVLFILAVPIILGLSFKWFDWVEKRLRLY